jgi:hypothetical protein
VPGPARLQIFQPLVQNPQFGSQVLAMTISRLAHRNPAFPRFRANSIDVEDLVVSANGNLMVALKQSSLEIPTACKPPAAGISDPEHHPR